MSIIKTIREYTELVKNGIKNGDKIIEAIRTSAKIKEGNGEITDEAIAEIIRRKEICEGCPFNSKNAEVQRNYSSSVPFQHCTLCQCRIGGESSKEYCLTCSCGMQAWNDRNPELKPMQLKWTVFEQPLTSD